MMLTNSPITCQVSQSRPSKISKVLLRIYNPLHLHRSFERQPVFTVISDFLHLPRPVSHPVFSLISQYIAHSIFSALNMKKYCCKQINHLWLTKKNIKAHSPWSLLFQLQCKPIISHISACVSNSVQLLIKGKCNNCYIELAAQTHLTFIADGHHLAIKRYTHSRKKPM